MKRILLLSFVLAFAVIGYSQRVYRSMLVNGKTWVYEKHHFVPVGTGNSSELSNYEEKIVSVNFVVEGDTLIDDVHYFKLMEYEKDNAPSYYAALREQGTAVFIIDKGAKKERLLQDFDIAKFPDAFEDGTPIFGFTEDKVIVSVNGREFVMHKYTSKEGYNIDLVAVEGIGFRDTALLLGMYPAEMSPSIHDDYYFFLRCEEGGEVIFTNSDFETAQPVPSSVDSARGIDKGMSSRIFDMQGRAVKERLVKGLYIQNGRKQVVKNTLR